MLVLAQREVETGINLLERYVERLGLRLNREKTRKLTMEQRASVDFLGFRFYRAKNRRTGKRLILVSPSPRSRQRCREKVRKLIHHSIPLRAKDQVQSVNRFLRGWVGYFRLGNSGAALKDVMYHVNKRVRRVIQRRQGNAGYGWGGRITSQYLFGTLGLYNEYRVCRL
jgi:RNA-directed DNA polymerase